jgi:hypothetical protein
MSAMASNVKFALQESKIYTYIHHAKISLYNSSLWHNQTADRELMWQRALIYALRVDEDTGILKIDSQSYWWCEKTISKFNPALPFLSTVICSYLEIL